MATPTAPSTSSTSAESYLAMDLNDATLIGKHCQYHACHQLDFLPFQCQSCRQTFCLDHRTESAHHCTSPGAWAERRRQAQLAKPSAGENVRMRDFVAQKPCGGKDCKTTIGTGLVPGVHCERCGRDYCLKHRLQDDHNCASLTPVGARPGGANKDAATSALRRLKAWGSQTKEAASRALPKPKPSSASARMVAVNNLKKRAKGDVKLAPEKRVYLFVEAEAATTTAKITKGEFFYSRDWVVGRLLDGAAQGLQVQNVNNASDKEEDRLRVFHVEGGRVLEFSEKVGDVLVSGNSVVLLRGVGAPADLITL